MKLTAEDLFNTAKDTFERYEKFKNLPLTEENIEILSKNKMTIEYGYEGLPLTEAEKIAFTLYNFVYVEEHLIRKNSDYITELTISPLKSHGYFSKYRVLCDYIESKISKDEAKYERRNTIKINVTDDEEKANNLEEIKKNSEYLFTIRNAIIHNHFEVENGMLKIDADMNEYTFKIEIPISLIHYMIIPAMVLREEENVVHSTGHDERISFEIHMKQIPFKHLINSYEKVEAINRNNIETVILELDKMFQNNNFTIWGAMQEIELIKDYELKENIEDHKANCSIEITPIISTIYKFYQGITCAVEPDISYPMDEIKLMGEIPDDIKNRILNIEKLIENNIMKINKNEIDENIPPSGKSSIKNNIIVKLVKDIKQKIEPTSKNINAHKKNIINHMNVEYTDDYVIAGDRKDNNKLPNEIILESLERNLNEEELMLRNKFSKENELLIRQVYNMLYMTEKNPFKPKKINQIIKKKNRFVERISQYYINIADLSETVDKIKPLAEILLGEEESKKVIEELRKTHRKNLKILFIYTVTKTIEHIEKNQAKNNNKDNIKHSTEYSRLYNKSIDFDKAKEYDFDIEEAKKIDQSNDGCYQYYSDELKKFIKIK